MFFNLSNFTVMVVVKETICLLALFFVSSYRINNCVGEQNQKYFLLFLFYTGECFILQVLSIELTFETKYSRMDQAKFAEDNL